MRRGPVVLELNDAAVTASSVEGPLAPPSPGYAVLDDAGLATGLKARARARLTPRRTHHRFWQELDRGALPRPFPRRWTRADLVHRHLADLSREAGGPPATVIAAAPGDLTIEQLGLFLGVAAAAEWPVSGLVDSAVAAASTVRLEPGGWRHLDLGLHRAVLTELAVGPGVRRRRVLVERGAGLVELERGWARFFAAAFVRATRYDPLHSAESEQRMYHEMDGWLSRLAEEDRGELALEGSRGRRHTVEVSRAEAVTAVAEIYGRIGRLLPAADDGASVLLAGRVARLPGIATTLGATGHRVEVLADDAPAAGALAAAELIAPAAVDTQDSRSAAPPLVLGLGESDLGAA